MQPNLLSLLLVAAVQPWLQAAVSADYASGSLWDLAAGNHSLTLCAATANASGLDTAFEIRAMDSAALASSVDANPVMVVNASVVAVGTNETRASYHAELSADEPCVHVVLPIETESFYLFLAQYSQEDLSISISDANGEDVAMAKCLTGCGQAAMTSRRLAEAAPSTSQQGHSESWAGPIVASLFISLTSLIGVFILGFDKGRAESIVEFATSFAAGCLMGVVVFHMWPEGLEYLEDAGNWVSGMYVLLGVAFSMAVEQGIHMVLESFGGAPCDHNHTHEHHPHHDHSTMDSHSPRTSAKLSPRSSSPGGHTHASHHLQSDNVVHPLTPLNPSRSSAANYETFSQKYVLSLKFVEPVAWITAMGDFFHAFVDGVVLAIGFKSCSASVGWSVALGIVLHEVPHRVGDFFIFLKAGMLVPQALLINFIASLSSLLGAIVLLAAGTVSDHTLGALLSFGTGALLFIAMVELMPPMLAVRERKRAWMHFAWFSFGCILIGLSVLQDTECEN